MAVDIPDQGALFLRERRIGRGDALFQGNKPLFFHAYRRLCQPVFGVQKTEILQRRQIGVKMCVCQVFFQTRE